MRIARCSVLAAAACALATVPTVSSSTAAAATHGKWLTWNVGAKTASLLLIAGYDRANNGFNFDGSGRGKLLVRIPLGWSLRVTCRNASSTRHSCAIVHGPQTVTPAFRGAASPAPRIGLRKGETARFVFRASRAGTYRIACLVPGHEEARMWDVLDIGGARLPSLSIRTGF